jgi:hypothetical protein
MSSLSPIEQLRLTDHAQQEMNRRKITESDTASVLRQPEQMEVVRPGRSIYQSRIRGAQAKLYLLRVIVDVDREPPAVVTVYRTSKIAKYWRV